MTKRKNIFVIIGSASRNSANEKLIKVVEDLLRGELDLTIFTGLKTLPHFDPDLSNDNPPPEVISFRECIEKSDGVLICTPEYIFSIPSGLKNAFEWCVATTVFSDKPVGLITASAGGEKGHEELKLIMTTLMTKFNDDTTLLIQGIKSKFDNAGKIGDEKLKKDIADFVNAFKSMLT